MKYLTVPTANLPDGRVIVERRFLEDVAKAVNDLNDSVKELREALASERSERKAMDVGLADRVRSTEIAVTRTADAIGVLIGGSDR